MAIGRRSKLKSVSDLRLACLEYEMCMDVEIEAFPVNRSQKLVQQSDLMTRGNDSYIDAQVAFEYASLKFKLVGNHVLSYFRCFNLQIRVAVCLRFTTISLCTKLVLF